MLTEENYIRDVPKKAVILFHGYGDNGFGMKGLAQAMAPGLPADIGFFCPNAPDPILEIPGGRMWFPLADYNPNLITTKEAAKDYFQSLIEAYKEKLLKVAIPYVENVAHRFDLKLSDVCLSGFSQGGFMALMLATYFGSQVAGTLPFSAVPYLDYDAMDENDDMPPLYLIHGGFDSVIPAVAFEMEKAFLDSYGVGYDSLLVPRMDHEIQPQALLSGQSFIAEVLKS